jgi:putative integral membrane protein (TIGR02587 family)
MNQQLRANPAEGSGQAGSEAQDYLRGLGRGFGAAVIFSIPMLMTMEMWWLGFYMPPLRLATAVLVMLPLLVILSHFAGLHRQASRSVVVLDALTGYGIGLVAAIVILLLFRVATVEMPIQEIVGKVLLLGLTASFGSMLGRTQLGTQQERQEEELEVESAGYVGEMFFMMAGAVYLSLTVAPTEEIVKIAVRLTPWLGIGICLLSIAMMHAFVYALEYRGGHRRDERMPWWSLFVRFTVPGYVIATGVAAYLLWSFGRFVQLDVYWMLMYSIVLALPASLGAAAGRLLL